MENYDEDFEPAITDGIMGIQGLYLVKRVEKNEEEEIKRLDK